MTDSSSSAPPRGRLLVVDDNVQNRELLCDILEDRGYEVEAAVDGVSALARLDERLADVVLLDVMMPGPDGFEICRRLKANPRTAPIPVLLVTSLAARGDRLAGIEAGANDFLTKPIDEQELVLRVRNALTMKGFYDDLQASYGKLQQLEGLRDSLTHMMVHDLKSPISGILGYLEMLQMDAEQFSAQHREFLDIAQRNTMALGGMIHSILDVSRLENGQMPLERAHCDASVIASEAVRSLGSLTNRATVEVQPPASPVSAFCDKGVIERVLANLISNAIKFTPRGGSVRIRCARAGDAAEFRVTDTGQGIPENLRTKIFEKYFQVESRAKGAVYSTGLGLTFCKLAVEAHGGTIGVDSAPGKGSVFWFTVPG